MKVRGVFPVGIMLILLLGVSSSFAQQYEDVVYLKGGGVRRGLILEQIPGESVKLKTKYGEIFVISMSNISKIVKEQEEVPIAEPAAKIDNAPRGMSDVKLESWYTYWGLGYANMSYTGDLKNAQKCQSCDSFSIGADLLGFYWPLKNQQTIVGFVYNGAAEIEEWYDGYDTKEFTSDSGQFSFSTMHFIQSGIGEGPFVRADLGLGIFTAERNDSGEQYTNADKSGPALLLGVGYGLPVRGGGTRILTTLSYALRPGVQGNEVYFVSEEGYRYEVNAEGGVRVLNITLGALF